ncbi:30S ribosomal protein S3 [Bienertia sinuspersici]
MMACCSLKTGVSVSGCQETIVNPKITQISSLSPQINNNSKIKKFPDLSCQFIGHPLLSQIRRNFHFHLPISLLRHKHHIV